MKMIKRMSLKKVEKSPKCLMLLFGGIHNVLREKLINEIVKNPTA